MEAWRSRLYSAYVSTGQGGQSAHQYFANRQAHLRGIIRRFAPQDRSVRIFDAGCGDGALLFVLKQSGYTNLGGVDLSSEMVALAHRAGVPEAELGEVCATLSAMPPASLDVVFAMDILEHLPTDELFATIDAAFRALAPGGRLVVHVPNAAGIFGGAIRDGDLTHERAFTLTSIRQLLHAAGFVEVTGVEDKPAVHGVPSALRSVVWAFGTMGFRLLDAAETGTFGSILTRNLLAVAYKPRVPEA
jgi:2-polyprenyl-3-methyl-5-hydroxy-6-metoxy-1,4-benzoquinol methylase